MGIEDKHPVDEFSIDTHIAAGLDVWQESLVQAFVVNRERTEARIVVTRVLEGRERVMRNWTGYSGYATADPRVLTFSEMPNDYRSLVWTAGVNVGELGSPQTDRVYAHEGATFEPGDTVHIHDMWYQNPDNDKQYFGKKEFCVLPVPNTGVEEAVNAMRYRNSRLAGIMARTIEHREQLALQGLPRIFPDEPYRPFQDFPDTEGAKTVNSRAAYGAGQVKDHFVDVTAHRPHEMDMEHGGVMRFGRDGSRYVTKNILPFGPGSDDDPLMQLEVHVHTTTVHNPAVAEQQMQLLIDGKPYIARVDVERSSHYFENPGHDVYFGGFTVEGVQDTAKLTEDQIAALNRKFDLEHDAIMRKVYEALNEGRDFVNQPRELNTEVMEEVARCMALLEDDKARIDSINDNEPESTIGAGALILVPRSMLDSVQIVFPAPEG